MNLEWEYHEEYSRGHQEVQDGGTNETCLGFVQGGLNSVHASLTFSISGDEFDHFLPRL
jgi:hypothetical protein